MERQRAPRTSTPAIVSVAVEERGNEARTCTSVETDVDVTGISLDDDATASSPPELARQPSIGSLARPELVGLRQRLSIDEYMKVLSALMKIVRNVRREPSLLTFRQIKTDCIPFSSTLLPHQEAMSILTSLGFEWTPEEHLLELPVADIDKFNRMVNLLQDEVNDVEDS